MNGEWDVPILDDPGELVMIKLNMYIVNEL